MKYIIRAIVVLVVSAVIHLSGWHPPKEILGVFFAVQGVIYSIAVSQLVGFNTSQVLNTKIRKEILSAISSALRTLKWWFYTSVVVYLLSFLIDGNIRISSFLVIDPNSIILPILLLSLVNTVSRFTATRELALKVEDIILKEKNNG